MTKKVPVAFTRVTSIDPSIVGKMILGFNRNTEKITAVTEGGYKTAAFETVAVDSFEALAGMIEDMRRTPGAALLMAGVAPIASGRLVCDGGLFGDDPDNPAVGGRVKQNFPRPSGRPGLVFIDCDVCRPDGQPWSCAMLVAVLEDMLGLPRGRLGFVWAPSSGSYLYRTDTTPWQQVKPLRGAHLILWAADASDVSRALDVLHDRLILAGFGVGDITPAGTPRVKTPVDPAMRTSSQPLFAAGAYIHPGLAVQQVAEVVFTEGDSIDTRALLPDLDDDESAEVKRIERELLDEISDEAAVVRRAHRMAGWREQALNRLGAGASEDDIAALVQDIEAHESWNGETLRLPRSEIIEAPDGSTITVDDLLDLPDDDPQILAWHMAKVRDPMGGEPKAGRLYLINPPGDSRPRSLYSRAGGGRLFHFGDHGGEQAALHEALLALQGGAYQEQVKQTRRVALPPAFQPARKLSAGELGRKLKNIKPPAGGWGAST